MLSLSHNSTPKQIKNHRNIIYWVLTGIHGQFKYVTAIQASYIRFLEVQKRNNTLKIDLTDQELDKHKKVLRLLTMNLRCIDRLRQYYKSDILTKSKKQK